MESFGNDRASGRRISGEMRRIIALPQLLPDPACQEFWVSVDLLLDLGDLAREFLD